MGEKETSEPNPNRYPHKYTPDLNDPLYLVAHMHHLSLYINVLIDNRTTVLTLEQKAKVAEALKILDEIERQACELRPKSK